VKNNSHALNTKRGTYIPFESTHGTQKAKVRTCNKQGHPKVSLNPKQKRRTNWGEKKGTANLDGGFEFKQIGLVNEDVSRSDAELLDL